MLTSKIFSFFAATGIFFSSFYSSYSEENYLLEKPLQPHEEKFFGSSSENDFLWSSYSRTKETLDTINDRIESNLENLFPFFDFSFDFERVRVTLLRFKGKDYNRKFDCYPNNFFDLNSYSFEVFFQLNFFDRKEVYENGVFFKLSRRF